MTRIGSLIASDPEVRTQYEKLVVGGGPWTFGPLQRFRSRCPARC